MPLKHLDVNDKDKLSPGAEAVRLHELLDAGFTLSAAAAELKISRCTAWRRLKLVEIDEGAPVKLLQINGLRLAEQFLEAAAVAAKAGNHKPAHAALVAAHLLEPVGVSGPAGPSVVVVVGSPEHPLRERPPQLVDSAVVTVSESSSA